MMNFEKLLTLFVIISGALTAIGYLCQKKTTIPWLSKGEWLYAQARSYFPMLLIVLCIRSFIMQFYYVPTGSLEPTVLPGDLLAVNQFAYGIKLPWTHKKIIPIGEPKRGDIAVFIFPINPSILLVKRVIGLAGDHIVYHDKTLYINGKVVPSTFKRITFDKAIGPQIPVIQKVEMLDGQMHDILLRKTPYISGNIDVVVPKGKYFMMGDNRDNSDDSRYWGFVSEKHLVGKAVIIVGSWNKFKTDTQNLLRWDRFFKGLYA